MDRRTSPLVALLAALILLPAAAQAQTPSSAPEASSAVAQPEPIRTLDKALELLAWDPALRGPLLVVDPQNTRLWTPKPTPEAPNAAPPLLPLPHPRDGYLLRTLAPYFGRKIVPVGTLTVLAPTEMVVLNTRPGKPNLLVGPSDDEAKRLLQASLSPVQWRLLGSEQGLGINDLAPEQQPLLLAILPQPFHLMKVFRSNEQALRVDRESSLKLSPDQRARVRLRMKRASFLSLMPLSPERDHFFSAQRVFGGPGLQAQGEQYSLVSHGDRRRNSLYGVTLRGEAPNRLKPGGLTFDAPVLDVSIPLGEAATVGELIRQVGQAARLELHADRRVAHLPIWVRGDRARAGDLLKALSWAVTGTFRRIESAFVLTDDIEGIGARRTLLSDWAEDAQSLAIRQREELHKRVVAQRPLQYLGFAPEDPLVNLPALRQRIEKEWATRFPRLDGYEFALTDLPLALQERVREQAAHSAERNRAVRTDRVRIGVNVIVSYVVPGIGEISSNGVSSSDLTSLLPNLPVASPPGAPPEAPPSTEPLLLPASLATRALCVQAATVEEARRVVVEAKKRDLTHLWLQMPEEGGQELLTAAIAAGKEQNLPVLAVVRLLSRPSPPGQRAPAADVLERNILGETAQAYAARRAVSPYASVFGTDVASRERFAERRDWLRPDAPASKAMVIRQMVELARLPGLGGIVLRDTAAIGYTDPGYNYFTEHVHGWDLGYTPEMRLAFLRQEGYDPIDIDRRGRFVHDIDLPFFPPTRRPESPSSSQLINGQMVRGQPRGDTPIERWNTFRHGINLRLMGELFAAVHRARPDLRLLVRDRSPFSSVPSGWYASWERPDLLPRRLDTREPARSEAQMARSQARHALRNITHSGWLYPPSPGDAVLRDRLSPAQRYAASLRGHLNIINTRGWDGVVLDLSTLPMENTLPLLEALPPVPQMPAKEKTP